MLFHSSIRKELARTFGATLVVLITIVMTIILIRTLGQASRGVVNPSEVMMVMGFSVLGYLPVLLTLSLFIAIVGTLSRMYAESEMVIWSSSEVPEPGWGLMDYVGNTHLDRWLAEKVLLGASQTQCAIPAGIFAKADGAMVQGIAYGQDLHLVHPSRPTDRRVAWEPEWTAQIRVKSQSMLPLDQGGEATKMEPQKPMMPAIPGLPNIGGALKGLFGR